MKQHGQRARQEGAIKRTEASIITYEEQLKNSNNSDEMNKLIKRKFERAKTTIKITKII